MHISILGDLSLGDEDQEITPPQGRLRTILALLTISSGKTVSTDAIIAELWHDSPPTRPLGAVQTYIYELRKTLRCHCGDDGERILITRPQGYSLNLEHVRLDYDHFESLVSSGVTLLADVPPELDRASGQLDKALSLWRGEPFGNVPCGEQLDRHVTWLKERRRRVLEMRIEADMRLSRYSKLIGELKVLVAEDPFQERFHELLMLALLRTGRRLEGLSVFNRLRERLTQELGIEPGPGVQEIHQRLLAGDTDTSTEDRQHYGRQLVHRSSSGRRPHATLVPDIADFHGRRNEIQHVQEHLGRDDLHAKPTVCIHGMPGIGKSAAAIHTAHLMADRFPDGQIHIDLHDVVDPAAIIRRTVTEAFASLGMPDDGVPTSIQGCVSAFRTLAAERNVLLVLDGVRSPRTVRKLLPAACPAIVTSCQPLYGVPGARMVKLEPLPESDAFALLKGVAGAEAFSPPEVDIAYGIIDLVGALPLAVRFIGERLALNPAMSIRQLHSRILASGDSIQLAHLERIGLDLYSRLTTALEDLQAHERAAFCALVPFRRRQFSVAEAAARLGLNEVEADLVLITMADAGLVRVVSDKRFGRYLYALHPLVALYAADYAAKTDAAIG